MENYSLQISDTAQRFVNTTDRQEKYYSMNIL